MHNFLRAEMINKENLKRIVDFLRVGIWETNLENFGKKTARSIKYLKVLLLAFNNFTKGKINYRAISLAYFSTISLIPCMALIFAVTQGFGLRDKLEVMLITNFSGKEEIVRQLMGYADNIIDVTNNGVFGIVTFLSFIWLVFWLMIQVEKAFNDLWKVKISRNIFKRIGAYIIIAFMLPFVLFMFLSTTLLFSQSAEFISNIINLPLMDKISKWVSWLITYISTSIILAMMYKFIPSSKVVFKKALQAAFITAIFFCTFQWLYIETQIFFSRWNGVFGAVAAIPFLMIWLNMSWFIVLFGSELTFAFQNVDSYKPRSIDGELSAN